MAGMVNAQASATLEASQAPGESRRYAAPLAVLTSLFFMWGFLTCMNDIIIPHLKAVFELSYARAMMIQFAFFAAYFVMSLPAGAFVKRFGYKSGICTGLLVAATGCALFYPAAGARSYGLFLSALFVLASGITLLQVAANPFVTALGKPESASARLTLTQAFNSLGTTIAPVFGSAVILSTAVKSKGELAGMTAAAVDVYRASEAASVQRPYLALAVTLVLLAAAIAAFRLPRLSAASHVSAASTTAGSIWRTRHLVLGAVAIFLYVGGEVAIGSFLVNFFKLPEIGGLTEAAGAKLVSLYWGGAMVGRFVGTFTLRRFDPRRVLGLHAAGAVLLIAVAMLAHGPGAVYSILAVGLFNSIMFPTIFALAIEGMGERTGQASGIVCMAIVGGAIVPVLQGALADSIGVQHAFALAALCYLYIAWYGPRGSVPVQASQSN
ncbi:MAG TPA: L-fucose:H+ symporter permease [Polyangiaceae bacterium]|nr:L-fucose:H+ symporter permease [Polyangiaceae bacterium]